MTSLKSHFIILAAALLLTFTVSAQKYAPLPLAPESVVFPGGASTARWLWSSQHPPVAEMNPNSQTNAPARKKAKAYFRYKFTLPEDPVEANIKVLYEKKAVTKINGKRLDNATHQPQVRRNLMVRCHPNAILALKKGENLLTVDLEFAPPKGNFTSYGFIMLGEIKLASGKMFYLASTPDFKSSPTAPEGWEKPDFDDSSWQPSMDRGDAWSLPWSREGDVAGLLSTPDDMIRQQKALKKACSLPASLASQPDPVARIVNRKGAVGIEVNGKVEPPILMHMRESTITRKESDMIVKTSRLGVRFYEITFNCRHRFIKPGVYDLPYLDRQISRIVNLAPDAYIIINIRNMGEGELARLNPDEQVGYAIGKPDQGDDLFGRPVRISAASKVLRREFDTLCRALTDEVKRKPWGKRVVGIRTSYGVYTEWQQYGHRIGMPDNGKAMSVAFREFLQQRYGNDAALQKAWRDPSVTIATAGIPDAEERLRNGRYLRDPMTDRKMLDYYECSSKTMLDLLLYMAKTVKTYLPNRLVGAYYGYVINFSYSPEGQNGLIDQALSSPYIDFLTRPYSYHPKNRLPGGDGRAGVPYESYRRHGKLFFIEDDIRTHLGDPKCHRDVARIGTRTPEGTLAVLQRDYGNMFTDGCGVQFLHFGGTYEEPDFSPNWFNCQEFIDTTATAIKLWREFFANPLQPAKNRVALVVDPLDWIRNGYPTWETNVALKHALDSNLMHALVRTGFELNYLTLDDFIMSKDKYNAVIFVNLFSPDARQRAGLIKRLHQPEVTAFYSYAPGLVTPGGFSEQAMYELTGIRLKVQHGLRSLKITSVDKKSSFSLPRGKETLRVYADDPECTILGRYAEGGQAAWVSKKLPSGAVSVFAGIPPNQEELWVALLKQTGSHAYTAPGVYCRATSNMVTVHVGEAGKYQVNLPGVYSKITDLYSGKTFDGNTDKITLEASGPKTWLLQLK